MIGASINAVIRDRIRDLRDRSGMGRDELAERARQYGAPESFTANVVGFLERGRRGLTLEELLALAGALEVTPLELLGDQAAVLVGEGQVEAPVCPSCGGEAGQLEKTVRADVDQLGELGPLEETLTKTAVRLAAEIDRLSGEGIKELPKLTRELRSAVEQILNGRRAVDPDDEEDDLDDLGTPD
ncbi:helix-turn-helix domain-containing protein [Micromonospora inyonensis]|uniref:Helix-turn-helix domain-containing protein n=1 Tax=Micromonospora inyonensis TaxID=47866 RepID=A0A1C6RDP7_9ACTN|nr:helix-turn-helix domain-containing protein [Micromonospora inyonensis]SCL15084.1 Helix-turn-helix domain-containing protein [Micromonospora inyonensis]